MALLPVARLRRVVMVGQEVRRILTGRMGHRRPSPSPLEGLFSGCEPDESLMLPFAVPNPCYEQGVPVALDFPRDLGWPCALLMMTLGLETKPSVQIFNPSYKFLHALTHFNEIYQRWRRYFKWMIESLTGGIAQMLGFMIRRWPQVACP